MLRLSRLSRHARYSSSLQSTASSADSLIAAALFPRTTALTSKKPEEQIIPATPYNLGVAPRKALSQDMFNERIAEINLHISARSIFKAEVIFHHLFRTNMVDLRRFVDAKLFNAFMEAYISQNEIISPVSIDRALEWFGRMRDMGYKPNLESYAILLELYCKLKDVDKIHVYLTKMHEDSLNAVDILHDYRFMHSPALSSILEAILRERGLDIKEYQPEGEMLLSVIEEQRESQILRVNSLPDSVARIKQLEKFEKTAAELGKVTVTNSVGVSLLAETLKKLVTTSNDDPLAKYEQQEWLEEECVRLALEQDLEGRESMPDSVKGLKNLRASVANEWLYALADKISSHLKEMNVAKIDGAGNSSSTFQDTDGNDSVSSAKDDQLKYLRFLSPLSSKSAALITISEFLKVPGRREMKEGMVAGEFVAGTVMVNIGRQVGVEYMGLEYNKKKNDVDKKLDYQMHTLYRQGKLFNKTVRRLASNMVRKSSASLKDRIHGGEWTMDMQAKIGALLSKFLIEVATIQVSKDVIQADGTSIESIVTEPAFYHAIEPHPKYKSRFQGMIRYNERLLVDMMKNAGGVSATIPRLLPMIVPPKPWMSYDSGGYLTHSSAQPLIRLNGNRTMRDLLRIADSQGKLQTVFHGLDVLGSTAWRINRLILEVVLKCWEDGKEWPSIPCNDVIQKPTKPEVGAEPAVLKAFYAENQKLVHMEQARYSQRCDANYKVLLAKAFENEAIFFPHYIDFRGRAYPLPVHLNHIGNDLCRGLLLFDDAKPLGADGLRWLKIQAANLFGKDKISFLDRVSFIDSNLVQIYDSADKPLDGDRFWLKADEPWQFLATCVELVEALRSPDPTEFKSRMPIHQDGTCNGLQHYAALGGDIAGAQQVNLYPSEQPIDVYTGISNKLDELVNLDAEQEVPAALLMRGKITRKLVKQTVMTNTYGVTLTGARAQVRARLQESRNDTGLTESEIGLCVPYITNKIFESYGNMFQSAQKIQKWLTTSARMISRSIHMSELDPDTLDRSEAVLSIGGAELMTKIREDIFGDFHQNTEEVAEKVCDGVEEEGAGVDLDEFGDNPMSELLDATAQDAMEIRKYNRKDADYERTEAQRAEMKSRKGPLRDICVTWTTPIGLPVVQPYRNFKSRTVKTCMQNLSLRDYLAPVQVNCVKQAAAFPPNFIHSLDASHMMLSAVACKADNLTFAAVHDSYWCHAGDVEIMGKHLREAFIKLHDKDIMGELKMEFEEWNRDHLFAVAVELDDQQLSQYKAYLLHSGKMKSTSKRKLRNAMIIYVALELPTLPEKGNFDIGMVRESKYFFH